MANISRTGTTYRRGVLPPDGEVKSVPYRKAIGSAANIPRIKASMSREPTPIEVV